MHCHIIVVILKSKKNITGVKILVCKFHIEPLITDSTAPDKTGY